MSPRDARVRGERSRLGSRFVLPFPQERVEDVVESFAHECEGGRQNEDEKARKERRPPRYVKPLPVQADVEAPIRDAGRETETQDRKSGLRQDGVSSVDAKYDRDALSDL